VRRLHQQAGLEGGNASSARRTFAVRLHRDGRSLKLIQERIGVSSLSAVKNLVEGDPVRLSAIVTGCFEGGESCGGCPFRPCIFRRLTIK
jgi:site-specific recombinase XerD